MSDDDPRDRPHIRAPEPCVGDRLDLLRKLLGDAAHEYEDQIALLRVAYDPFDRRSEYMVEATLHYRARSLGILTEMRELFETLKR